MIRVLSFVFAWLGMTASAQAFCGFYVAKADGQLYNQASKVVFVRHGNRSVITMSSDYRGAPKDFALIVPTPKVLKREQVRTVKAETVAHLDAYSAPRLVEYHDHDPCAPVVEVDVVEVPPPRGKKQKPIYRRADALGVKIKQDFAVGNYDILILAAKQSDGLAAFLLSEGYKLPDLAEATLGAYIKGGMKFFVAKVNLERHKASKAQELPPLQIAFRSQAFMLPIQLGKLNADQAQDALIMTLTKRGRVEPTNYRLVDLPTNRRVPTFVEDKFAEFYKTMFARTVPFNGLVLEYGWDMAWCDPCAADPLSRDQLEELGVFWLKDGDTPGQDVYVTRLHAQYTKHQMREDLMFKVTSNKDNFQGRYVMNQPFVGDLHCEAAKDYVEKIRRRLRDEAHSLGKLTGWAPRDIERQIRRTVPASYW